MEIIDSIGFNIYGLDLYFDVSSMFWMEIIDSIGYNIYGLDL